MNILSGLFKSRDKPTNSLNGSGYRFFFATGAGVLIHMDWQTSDGLGENPDAGIDCSHLHSTSFIDGLARVAATKEKTVGATIGAVGGLVSGMKQS